MSPDPRTPTLYLTRNGLLEPLGQSQVFGYLRGLSCAYRITLITYEKPEDWDDASRMAAARAECERHGIAWHPQRFVQRPRYLAPAAAMLGMVWGVWRTVRRENIRLLHGRSYIPSAVLLVVGRITAVPFIFDMRALWPEELITAGRLRRGSVMHRMIVAAERACLHRAAAVVSLTHAAVRHLQQAEPAALAGQRVVVIPTCADLQRFRPASSPPNQDAAPVHACIGTILSGWFRADWLAAWWAAVAVDNPQARFEILTRDDTVAVRQAVDPQGRLGERLQIRAVASADMPEAVRAHAVAVMFFTGGLSKLGSAPTRLAEVLGSGLPVVANAGVGDVADVLREHRVGVLLQDTDPASILQAQQQLAVLQADPELPHRARAAAEVLFSLEAGTRAYAQLYADVLRNSG